MLRPLAAILLSLLTGCALIPMSAASRDLRAKETLLRNTVGCYHLSIGEWSPPQDIPAPEILKLKSDVIDSRPYNLPGVSELEIREMQGSSPAFTWSRPTQSNWRMMGSDTVVLAYGAAYHGVSATLAREGSILKGTARYWTDVIDGKPLPTAAATAVRVECPATR